VIHLQTRLPPQLPADLNWAIDITRAPTDPVERDIWVKRRRIDILARALGLDPHDMEVRRIVGSVLSYRETRDDNLVQARVAYDAGRTDEVKKLLVAARSGHRVAMRRLRQLRALVRA
jgi:hypothetical protein